MASLPPSDWQGLNPDLLHLCLLRTPTRDIVRAASTCKRWRAILTPRFWKELCIQEWPSAGVLAQIGAVMDFFACAKALYRQQQHSLLLPERWTRPEADIDGIVLLLDGDFGKGKFNLALPFADATSDNFNFIWTVPTFEIDYDHFHVHTDVSMRLFRPESTAFALTESEICSYGAGEDEYHTSWFLRSTPAAEFYANGAHAGDGGCWYQLQVEFIPSTGTNICTVEPPDTFSDDARRGTVHASTRERPANPRRAPRDRPFLDARRGSAKPEKISAPSRTRPAAAVRTR